MFKRPDYIQSTSKHHTADGYDKNVSYIKGWEAIKSFVKDRDKVCECGAEITDVHHIDDDRSNNPPDGSNWAGLCRRCHNSKRTTKRFNKPNYMR